MPRRAKCIGFPVALAILVWMLWSFSQRDAWPVFYVPRSSIPPPVTATLNRGNGPVRAFFGPLHALLILPDGSLWEWGGLGGFSGAKIRVPTRIGTNDDWVEAAVAEGHYLGIRKDGTLWNWGATYSSSPLALYPLPVTPPALPEQVGFESSWVRLAASGSHSAVLRRDGTVWAWGDDSLGQIGNGLGPHETNRVKGHGFVMEKDKWERPELHEGRTNLVQVGRNHNWTSITSGFGPCTFGLRADGTLWAWGTISIWGAALTSTQMLYSVPTQVCRESNWVQISGQIALNSKGEAWWLFSRLPDAALPASSSCDLLAGSCLPGRSALGPSEIFQLHSDGTLWAGKLAWPAKDRRVRPATKWRQIGKRSDWISLDGWSGTVIGVTADGTIWTWGTDISQEGVEMLQSRIETLKRKAMTLLRAGPASYSSAGIMPVQKEPRELMRLNFKPGAGGTTDGQGRNYP